MKLLLIISLLFFSIFNCQDLKMAIVNDTIKKVSYYDQCNIVYTITNTSDKDYYFILDSKEFNEDPEYSVELFYVGLPDYYVYEKNEILKSGMSSGKNGNTILNIDTSSDEFKKFSLQYSKFYNDYDLSIPYRMSKNIVFLKPKETKVFTTKVNFPNYMRRYYKMLNKRKYFFQISLNNPKEIISKYFKAMPNFSKKDIKVFTGQIISNKVPLVYEVYNDK